jgi:hypothetical protein
MSGHLTSNGSLSEMAGVDDAVAVTLFVDEPPRENTSHGRLRRAGGGQAHEETR